MPEPDETPPFNEPRKFREPKKRAPGSGARRRPEGTGVRGLGSTAERLASERIPLDYVGPGYVGFEGSLSVAGIIRRLLNEGWTPDAIRAELRAWRPKMSKDLRGEAKEVLADPESGGPSIYSARGPVSRERTDER